MTEITMDTASLAETRNFLIQYLRDAGYTGSVEDGTAVHDIVIKPMAMALSVFKQETAKTKAYLSVAQAEQMQDILGDEYDDVIDSILSNWFVARKDGELARLNVRLFFTEPPDVIQFNSSQSLLILDDISFGPSEDKTIFNTDLIAHLNPLGGVEKYSYTLLLTAHTSGTIVTDPLVTSPSFSVNVPNFLSGEVLTVASVGSEKEDSEQFIARTKKSITTRELITDRAISTVLGDEIAEVTDTYVAGYGSPEQIRDVNTFAGVTVHTGNKSDIYVKTALDRVTQKFTVTGGGAVPLNNTGILQVFKVTSDDGLTQYSFTEQGHQETLMGSLKDTHSIVITGPAEGDVVLVDALKAPALLLPTALLTDEDHRVGCYDPLVKEMFPIILSGTLTVALSTEALVNGTVETLLGQIQDSVVTFIRSLGSNDVFRMSALIAYIHSQHPDTVEQVETPVSLTYSILNPLNGIPKTGTVSSKFTLPYFLSAQVTDATTQYYSDASLITITQAGN